VTNNLNLVDDNWIRVIDNDATLQEVSIREVLTNADKYKALSGELPTQNVAILRFLLAILYRVFMYKDVNGREDSLFADEWSDLDELMAMARERWEALWKMKKFPETLINQYLDEYHDRFWLFDDQHPFYQVPKEVAQRGTKYTAGKLNGEVSESNNKERIFANRSRETRYTLTFPEAARWVIHYQGFDDTSGKEVKEYDETGKKIKKDTCGAGWLGRLGLIYAEGNNLFETLMLNLVLFRSPTQKKTQWSHEAGRPAWELDEPRVKEREKIRCPENPCELFTLQSRRIWLEREGNTVTTIYMVGGDFFDKENAFAEPMTLWRAEKKKTSKSKKTEYTGKYYPKPHTFGKHLWREFSSVLTNNKLDRVPGIIEWLSFLQQKDLEEHTVITPDVFHVHIVSTAYKDKYFCVNDVFEDSLSFHANIMTKAKESEGVLTIIQEEIENCEKAAKSLETLEKSVKKAVGLRENPKKKMECMVLKGRYFEQIDELFQKFILELDAQMKESVRKEKQLEWQKTSKRIAGRIAREYIAECGPEAVAGRTIIEKGEKGDVERHYSAGEAINYFRIGLAMTYPEYKQEEPKEGENHGE